MTATHRLPRTAQKKSSNPIGGGIAPATPEATGGEVSIGDDEVVIALPATGAGTAAKETVTHNHTYTTSSGLYCWRWAAGIYYARETFYVWYDNPFGGHYLAYSYYQQYGRCYIG